MHPQSDARVQKPVVPETSSAFTLGDYVEFSIVKKLNRLMITPSTLHHNLALFQGVGSADGGTNNIEPVK